MQTSSFFCSSVFSSRYTEEGRYFLTGASLGASLTEQEQQTQLATENTGQMLRNRYVSRRRCGTGGHVFGLQADLVVSAVRIRKPGSSSQSRLPPHSCLWEHIVLEELFLYTVTTHTQFTFAMNSFLNSAPVQICGKQESLQEYVILSIVFFRPGTRGTV